MPMDRGVSSQPEFEARMAGNHGQVTSMEQDVSIRDRKGMRVCIGQQHEACRIRLLRGQMVDGEGVYRPYRS